MTLSAFLGANPRDELHHLQGMQISGQVLRFLFYRTQLNASQWVIQSLNRVYETFDEKGRVLSVTVNVTLLEYPGREQT
jgi:hypothetical protein